MRYALTFLLMATIALGQGVWPKTATVVDGGHRYDFDTLGKRSVTPSADYGNIVLWQAFSYSDNSDADFYDLSTSGNDGAQGTAASQPVFSSGVGGHYIYDGIDDFVTFGTPALGTADYTLSAWGYLESGTTRPFVTENDISSPTSTGFEFPMVSIAASSIAIQRSALGSYSGTISISTNEWHFVTFSRTSGTMAGYLDGAVVSLSGGGSAYDQNGYDFTGTEFFSSKFLFNTATYYNDGRHDDLRVYSTALTAAQILAVADNTAATYYPYFSGFTESFDTYADLALWMPFTSDETPDYIDKGPIGNDGSQTTAASQPTWSSADGGVYDFDGVDDCFTIADSASLDVTTDITILAWVKFEDTGASVAVLSKGDATATTLSYRLFPTNVGRIGGIVTGNGTLDASNAKYYLAPNGTVSTSVWQHVGFTYDATTLKIFANGANVSDGSLTKVYDASVASIYAGTDVLQVGRILQGGSPLIYFEGKIDDTRIYSTALTAAEILAIADNTGATYYPYFSGFTESFDTYADLALWMPFTSDETPDYIDKGPIGNDGSQTTAASQPTWSSADGGTYSFDGVDDTIHIDDLPSAVSSDTVGAIMLWMKPTTAPPAGTEVMFSFGDTSANAFLHFQRQATGKFLCSIRKDPTTSGWQVQTTSTTVFSSGTWTHVALVQNGTRPLFYIDGTLAATADDVTTDLTAWVGDIVGMDNARVACRSYGGGGDANFFDGDIDDVRMYDRVLTATEILAIKNNTQH